MREQGEISSGRVSIGQLPFPSSECQLALGLIKYSSFPPFPLLLLAFATFFFFLQDLLLWLLCASLGFYGLCWSNNVKRPGIPLPLQLLSAHRFLVISCVSVLPPPTWISLHSGLCRTSRQAEEARSLTGCGCWTSLQPVMHLVLLALQGRDSTWAVLRKQRQYPNQCAGYKQFCTGKEETCVVKVTVTVFPIPANSPFTWQPLADPCELLHLSHCEELASEQREDFLWNWTCAT